MATRNVPGVYKESKGTAAAWAMTTKPITAGMRCIETDTGRSKLGDGVRLYADLPYLFVNPSHVDGIPVGALVVATTAAPPAGCVKANGALLSRTTYNELWAMVQDSAVTEAAWSAGLQGRYSVGDGTTTFRVPDLRGEFLRGLDDGRGVDSGRGIGAAQAAALESHTHVQQYLLISNRGSGTGDWHSPASGTTSGATTGATGGTETRPRNIAYPFCIKAWTTTASAAAAHPGLFSKADPFSAVFSKTGAQSVSLKAGTTIEVAGITKSYAVSTAVVMPALVGGTDYAIYACTDGTVRADASFTAPTGYTTANSRRIGGFHYGIGDRNVSATPNINAYSLWDLKWRPACPDPRGMVLVAGGFWCDIYLLGVNHHTDGTSKYGATIADGSTPPKVSPLFGGNGTTDYGSLTWHEAAEVMASHGKALLSYGEFSAMAYGVSEGTSVGSDPVTTGRSANYTSKWGIEQATGCMWQWGSEFGGPYNTTAADVANTESRGSTFNQARAAIFGGDWSNAAVAGSRCSHWGSAPSISAISLGARGRADHVCTL